MWHLACKRDLASNATIASKVLQLDPPPPVADNHAPRTTTALLQYRHSLNQQFLVLAHVVEVAHISKRRDAIRGILARQITIALPGREDITVDSIRDYEDPVRIYASLDDLVPHGFCD